MDRAVRNPNPNRTQKTTVVPSARKTKQTHKTTVVDREDDEVHNDGGSKQPVVLSTDTTNDRCTHTTRTTAGDDDKPNAKGTDDTTTATAPPFHATTTTEEEGDDVPFPQRYQLCAVSKVFADPSGQKGRGKPFYNNSQVLEARSLREVVKRPASNSVLQGFVKCKGPQSVLYRYIWKKALPGYKLNLTYPGTMHIFILVPGNAYRCLYTLDLTLPSIPSLPSSPFPSSLYGRYCYAITNRSPIRSVFTDHQDEDDGKQWDRLSEVMLCSLKQGTR
jgi:hypothetical protein